jgi:hypothetical protein
MSHHQFKDNLPSRKNETKILVNISAFQRTPPLPEKLKWRLSIQIGEPNTAQPAIYSISKKSLSEIKRAFKEK